jgi:hypothetical protein
MLILQSIFDTVIISIPAATVAMTVENWSSGLNVASTVLLLTVATDNFNPLTNPARKDFQLLQILSRYS